MNENDRELVAVLGFGGAGALLGVAVAGAAGASRANLAPWGLVGLALGAGAGLGIARATVKAPASSSTSTPASSTPALPIPWVYEPGDPAQAPALPPGGPQLPAAVQTPGAPTPLPYFGKCAPGSKQWALVAWNPKTGERKSLYNVCDVDMPRQALAEEARWMLWGWVVSWAPTTLSARSGDEPRAWWYVEALTPNRWPFPVAASTWGGATPAFTRHQWSFRYQTRSQADDIGRTAEVAYPPQPTIRAWVYQGGAWLIDPSTSHEGLVAMNA